MEITKLISLPNKQIVIVSLNGFFQPLSGFFQGSRKYTNERGKDLSSYFLNQKFIYNNKIEPNSLKRLYIRLDGEISKLALNAFYYHHCFEINNELFRVLSFEKYDSKPLYDSNYLANWRLISYGAITIKEYLDMEFNDCF